VYGVRYATLKCLTALPIPCIAAFKGPTSKGRGGQGEREGREGHAKGEWKGKERASNKFLHSAVLVFWKYVLTLVVEYNGWRGIIS